MDGGGKEVMETAGVKELVRQELRRIRVPEKKFHSPHEAWAVLFEEIEEAYAEMARVANCNDHIRKCVFSDSKASDFTVPLKMLKESAINLSAEAVQVAAVAEKFTEFLEDRKPKTWSEFFEEWEGERVAMHCKTEAEAREFCDIMKNQGMVWRNESSYDVTKYDCYGENTCYYFNKGMFGHREYGKENGDTILEFSDYKELKDD
jgi:hypothetical protein